MFPRNLALHSCTWIYNLVAKRFGGIKVELQSVQTVSNLGLV